MIFTYAPELKHGQVLQHKSSLTVAAYQSYKGPCIHCAVRRKQGTRQPRMLLHIPLGFLSTPGSWECLRPANTSRDSFDNLSVPTLMHPACNQDRDAMVS